MKIDLIIGSLQSGGAERVVSLLGNHFAKKNETRIITFRNIQKYELSPSIKRIRFHRDLPILNYTLVRAMVYLFIFYSKRKNRPDIISSHIDMLGLVTIPIGKIYNIPIIVSEHNNHATKKVSLQKKILWNFFYRYADAVTVLTDYDLPFFKKRAKKVVVLHNPSSFEPIKCQNGEREKSVLAIGSLDRYHHKGFDNLLEIAKEVLENNIDWKFKIVGEGDSGKMFLQKKAEQLGIKENIEFMGFRKDIPNLLQNSAIYILSSRFEGLPMVLIEATSQGIACIAYDCITGPSEIIENNMNGILVRNQDKDEMVTQLIKLIENKELRLRLGKNAIESSNRFNIKKIGEQWENLFLEVLKKGKNSSHLQE